MHKEPDISGAVGAINLLQEQLEESRAGMNDSAAEAAKAGDYDAVRKLIEKAEEISNVMALTDTLLAKLTDVFGMTADSETPKTRVNLNRPPPFPGGIRLELRNRHCHAYATYSGGSVTVLRGSTIALNERESLQDVLRERRRILRRRGELTENSSGRALALNADCDFGSPSGAACFVMGYTANGRRAWTIQGTGETLGEWLDAGRV